MSRFASLVLAMTIGGMLCAQDAPKLPDADQALIDRTAEGHLLNAAKAYDAYQKALSDAAGKTLKDLDKVKLDAMKRGNLPLAVAIDAKEKEIRDGSLGTLITERSNTDVLGGLQDAKSAMINELCSVPWKHKGQFTYRFKKDLTYTEEDRGGKYEVSDDGKTVTLHWADGYHDEFITRTSAAEFSLSGGTFEKSVEK